MRTTVEIRDEHRARLLDLAARRGEKGFSRLVEEALDRYFEAEEARQQVAERALSVLGSLSDEAADRLEESARRVRATWR